MTIEPIVSIVSRTVIVYLFIVVAIRLFGKKELAQLSVIDLVFILLISNSVQNAMVGPDTSLWGGIIAAASLFVVNAGFKYFLFRSKKFTELVEGHAVMLIHKGKVIEKNIQQQKISLDELEAVVREHGLKEIEEVDLAVLEVDGNISVLSEKYQKKTSKKRKQHKVLSKVT